MSTSNRLSISNPQAAQSFLTHLLKPQDPLQTAFREDSSGTKISDCETLQHIASDVAHRTDKAGGDPSFDIIIKDYVGKTRAE